ncbi:hypothetical protein WG66_016954 [Moniliophthora roreri]|nr:hypothetical protein WG66_016954 [Moniliophthora roreri]
MDGHDSMPKSASLNPSFHGTAAGVYGTIKRVNENSTKIPSSRYSVGGRPTTLLTPSRLNKTAYLQPFHQSPILEDRERTLLISLDTEDADYYLDYFNITPGIQGMFRLRNWIINFHRALIRFSRYFPPKCSKSKYDIF